MISSFVLVEEGPERLDGHGGAGPGIDGELGPGDLVDADLVDDLVKAALHVDELLAQLGVGGDRPHRLGEHRRSRIVQLRVGGLGPAGGELGRGELAVGVDRFDEAV